MSDLTCFNFIWPEATTEKWEEEQQNAFLPLHDDYNIVFVALSMSILACKLHQLLEQQIYEMKFLRLLHFSAIIISWTAFHFACKDVARFSSLFPLGRSRRNWLKRKFLMSVGKRKEEEEEADTTLCGQNRQRKAGKTPVMCAFQ